MAAISPVLARAEECIECHEVTLADLHAHLSSAFASWQLPESFITVSEIPRTSVGKCDKKTIRTTWAGHYGGTDD